MGHTGGVPNTSTRDLELPTWCDWDIAVSVVQQTVAVVGETIDPERGLLSWADRGGSGEVDAVAVSRGRSPGTVTVTTEAGDAERVEQLVRRRLHLDLTTERVEGVVEHADYPGLPEDALPFRVPSATDPWAFCLTYLSGGSPAHAVTRTLFELGEPCRGHLLPPTPETFAVLSQEAVEEIGVIPRRARALREVAAAFADSPELADPAQFAQLPSQEAVARVLELPRLGRTRAPLLAALGWGHDDVPYDPYSPVGAKAIATEHRSALSDAFERTAPWRSVLADTVLVDLLTQA